MFEIVRISQRSVKNAAVLGAIDPSDRLARGLSLHLSGQEHSHRFGWIAVLVKGGSDTDFIGRHAAKDRM